MTPPDKNTIKVRCMKPVCRRLKQTQNPTGMVRPFLSFRCLFNTKCVFPKWNISSTVDRLPPAIHPLQRSPTWASTVCTGDKVFGTARLLWASEAEVAVTVGDDGTVWCFFGWKEKRNGKRVRVRMLRDWVYKRTDECELSRRCFELSFAGKESVHWERLSKKRTHQKTGVMKSDFKIEKSLRKRKKMWPFPL